MVCGLPLALPGSLTVSCLVWYAVFLHVLIYNPFTTGNPFWGAKLLGFSIGRGSGALKGLTSPVILIVAAFASPECLVAEGAGKLVGPCVEWT